MYSKTIANKIARRLSRLSLATGDIIGYQAIKMSLRDFGLEQADQISTHMTRSELKALHKLSSTAPRGAVALEIGSYIGASTCFLAVGLREVDGHLHCVDTWMNETMLDGERDTFQEFKTNTKGVADTLTLIRKRSDEVSEKELPPALDLVFIDADHSYEAVKYDFKLIEGRVSEKGVVIFHDCLWFSGVSKFVGETLASGKWVMGGFVDNLGWIRRTPKDQKT